MEEPPTDGIGFPFPKGGWEYGKNTGNHYYYTKEEQYIQKMKQIETRVTYQLAHTYAEDINHSITDFEHSLDEHSIVIIYNDEDSIASLLFKYNVIHHQRIHFNDIQNMTFIPGNQVIILSDMPFDFEGSVDGLNKIVDFVENGGSIISINTGGVLLEKMFPNKIKMKNGLTTMDKQIDVEIYDEQKEYDKVFKM